MFVLQDVKEADPLQLKKQKLEVPGRRGNSSNFSEVPGNAVSSSYNHSI